MKIRNIIIGFLFLSLCSPAAAQKKKSTKKAPTPQPVVVEETPEQRLFKTMLPATAKVLFVDSVVVDKNDFLSNIPLSSEVGMISTYEDFFNRQISVPTSVFVNEFGDRCYYAEGDSTNTTLYSIDRLGDKWSKPRQLSEFGNDYAQQNYPFLQSDGVTLFFAAKGEHSLGGYDIFMTVYDTEESRFYRPENFGLPFNSTANDYLIAIDEVNELGYLVSDRHQPSDKVCIYTFVPQFPRKSFEDENVSDHQLERYARLTSISDTWAFGDRQAALKRYKEMISRNATKNNKAAFSFVVNDQIVCHQLTDFISPEARVKYQKYASLANATETDKRTLDMQREKFAKASAREQRQMRETMVRLEHQIAEDHDRMQKLAKEIRYVENRVRQ